MQQEFNIRRWFLWLPVFIALGNAAYFTLPQEPPWGFVLTAAFSLISLLTGAQIGVIRVLRHRAVGPKVTFLCTRLLLVSPCGIAFVLGFTVSKIRTLSVNTPQLSQSFQDLTLAGDVEIVEDVARGTFKHPRMVRRCTLKVSGPQLGLSLRSVCLRAQGPLNRLRNVRPGDQIVIRADINPSPAPISLHGYDAPFDLYFKGISGLAKVRELVAVKRDSPLLKPMTTWEYLRKALTRQRRALSTKIRQVLPSEVAPLATALITGDKSGITLKTREDFTRAGLSHMLAISGLHMGLVAGLVFFLFVRCLVLVPRLATRFMVQKIAAFLTIPVILAYLVISGASFSAWRAFLMVTLSMVALMVGQRPLSLRCTAVAASCILLLFPESLFSVSFQLSFAAVTALCWVYEKAALGRVVESLVVLVVGPQSALWRAWARRFVRFVLYSLVTTTVATLATTPLILYVFQRTTLVSVVGNLFAIPFLSFVVVPLALLSVFSLALMPAGWPPVWTFWGNSLRGLCHIASTVAHLPGSDWLLPKPSCGSLLLLTLGLLGIMLSQGKQQRLALVPVLAGFLGFFLTSQPDLWVTARGEILALRSNDTLFISSLRRGGFHAKVWAQECGLRNVQPMTWQEADKWRQILAADLARLCHNEDLLLVYRKGRSWKSQMVSASRKHRPWCPPVQEDFE